MLTNMLGFDEAVWEELREKFTSDVPGLMHFTAGYAAAWTRRDREERRTRNAETSEVGASGAPPPQAAVTFYFDPVFRSLSVWTFLETCKIPYEQHLVNVMRGDLEQPALAGINPFGRLPMLQIGGTDGRTITSRGIMLKYLCAAHPRRTARFACSSTSSETRGACSQSESDPSHMAIVSSALEALAEVEKLSTILVQSASGFCDKRSQEWKATEQETASTGTHLRLLKDLLNRFRRAFLPQPNVFVAGAAHPTLADLYLACEIIFPLKCSTVVFNRDENGTDHLPPFIMEHFHRVTTELPLIPVLASGASNGVGFGVSDYIRLIRRGRPETRAQPAPDFDLDGNVFDNSTSKPDDQAVSAVKAESDSTTTTVSEAKPGS